MAITFTQKVEAIARDRELTTKKAIAEFLGVNDSTLGSALRKDTPETPYTGAVADVVDAKHEEMFPTTSHDRAKPRGKLNDLRRIGVARWAASIDAVEIEIAKTGPKEWVAFSSDRQGEAVAQERTFKAIIGSLRVLAAVTAD